MLNHSHGSGKRVSPNRRGGKKPRISGADPCRVDFGREVPKF